MIRWRSYDLKHAAKISAESGEVFHPAVLDFSFLLFLVLSASCDLRWCICASAGPTGILVYFMAPCLQWISLHLSSRGWQDFLCVCVSADYCKCGIWQESKKVSIYWKKEYICIYCNIDSIQWCRCMTVSKMKWLHRSVFLLCQWALPAPPSQLFILQCLHPGFFSPHLQLHFFILFPFLSFHPLHFFSILPPSSSHP